MNKDGKVKRIKLSIKDAYEEYRNVQNINSARVSTLDRVDNSMKALCKVWDEDYPIASLTYSHIQEYKEYWHGKHAPTTMNINLSKIRVFHNWCVMMGYAKKKIDFVLVKEDSKPIAYLTEDELNGIMKCDIIDVHFRKSFLFYYMTGCSKSEPFEGKLSGSWLTIEPNTAKGHTTRDIQLSSILKTIVTEMINRFNMLIDEYKQKPRHTVGNFL